LGAYDVIIIGAGIVGSMIARELSKYEGHFAILEKESFPGFGVSKANPSMLHSPLLFPAGPLRIKLAYNAAARYKRLADELDVVFKEVGEIFLAFDPNQLKKLETAKNWAEHHNVSAGHEIIAPDKIRQLEPNVSPKAIAALYGEGVGGIYATEWTFALIENAAQNSLKPFLNSPVHSIIQKANHHFEVKTPNGWLQTKFIINAAGIFADEVAHMVGDRDIHLTLTKGVMVILDKSVSNLVNNMVYGTYGKDHSQLITPTAHGNVLAGLGYFTKPAHKADTAVTRAKLAETINMGKALVPTLSAKDVITSFAGIRSENSQAPQGDFYIDHSEHAPGVIHAVIGSPGLTAAPAIAEYILGLLANAGFRLEEKDNFQKKRAGWPHFGTVSWHERQQLITANPKYGHVICRCEQVTEAEISEAIDRGADTMDALKHLTRAGMGRCQGAFCGTTVLNHLADQLGIPASEVTKKGRGSNQIKGFCKAVH
jgi:glycerol-3-phosphate dehydrogenase